MSATQSSAIRSAQWSLRIGLGAVWIYEGLVPKLLVPLTDLEMSVVSASGLVPNHFTAPFLHVLGSLEIALGLLVIAGLWPRPLCAVQLAIVGAFTVIIPLTAPACLAHPFGLLSKNIAILGAVVALWFLYGAERERKPSSSDSVQVRYFPSAGPGQR